MPIHDEPYIHDSAGYDELRTFLRRSANLGAMPMNWLHGRLDNWAYAGKDRTQFYCDNTHLWRHSSGTLVGFCISEGGENDMSLQVHPAQRDIEDDMLAWVEETWAGRRAQVEVFCWEHDLHRQAGLTVRGYVDHGECGRLREYDLLRGYPQRVLPPGFAFKSLAEGGNVPGRIFTEALTFGSVAIDAAWHRGKSSAPGYAAEWDLGIIAPSGEWVAFALAWPDSEYGVAEIDPVGTHPDQRQRGFAQALLFELFRQLRAAGLQRAYIGSGGEPNPSNRLYESLCPARRWVEHVWRKNLAAGDQHV
jgi:GNAT superfamily N-acetyltransferase